MSKETTFQSTQAPVYEYRFVDIESTALDSVFKELFELLEKQSDA